MAEKTLIANVRPAEDDAATLLVASPVVGRADGVPAVGAYLNPFDAVVTVDILNERYTLRLPRDVQGRISETFIPRALTAVGYNEPLVRLDPRSVPGGGSEAGTRGVPGVDSGAAEGVIQITSPTEGIFYRKPSPDAPPYVEEGSRITLGSSLGLVEVMKCFNPITYGGPGFPEHVEVVRILVQDSSEVHFGQPLFWVRAVE